MPDRLMQSSMHPMIQYKVIGYRVDNLKDSVMQEKPKPIPIEAKREYHIGLIYPHKPIYEGVLYVVQIIPGAHLSDEYLALFRKSPYTDQYHFNIHELTNCPYCNKQGPYELIDERRAPGA